MIKTLIRAKHMAIYAMYNSEIILTLKFLIAITSFLISSHAHADDNNYVSGAADDLLEWGIINHV